MTKAMLAALNDSERLLVAETEPRELNDLNEDEVVELHTRIRRARNKYVGQYRRGATARVGTSGGRGKARPKNTRAALKAEVFEQALSNVSRRLGVLARQSATALKNERLEDARAAKRGQQATSKRSSTAKPSPSRNRRSVTSRPTGDRALRSPAREKNRGGTRAVGDRRQAKRDSR